MRVTISHREESAGVSGNKRNYFVDAEILFSEEEKSIIQARALYQHNFSVGPAVPPRTRGHFVGAGLLRAAYRLIIVAGFVLAIAYSGGLGGFLVFIGIAMGVTGFIMDRRGSIEDPDPPQTITIRRLLDSPRISIYALDPADAKAADDLLRQSLSGIKGLLEQSAEIRIKETFEL
jgi:hypothetical protein